MTTAKWAALRRHCLPGVHIAMFLGDWRLQRIPALARALSDASSVQKDAAQTVCGLPWDACSPYKVDVGLESISVLRTRSLYRVSNTEGGPHSSGGKSSKLGRAMNGVFQAGFGVKRGWQEYMFFWLLVKPDWHSTDRERYA